jgi:hypothetical protein
MKQDEIIEMAREAGWKDLRDFDLEMNEDIFMGRSADLVAFAKLVAAKEREDVIQHLRELKVLSEDGTFTNEIRARGQA